MIDVNEANGGTRALLTLSGLRISTSSSLQTGTTVDNSGLFSDSLGTIRFDLGSGNSVLYRDTDNGSGSGDINFFIPTAVFGDAISTDYVYLYEKFSGSEETAILKGLPVCTPH
ncbi:MAG: hypothetical protein H7Y20_06140 [Bryobacteraceae bacterium]|nr:hypothetical protein [Bryobacteraceae bacterium]